MLLGLVSMQKQQDHWDLPRPYASSPPGRVQEQRPSSLCPCREYYPDPTAPPGIQESGSGVELTATWYLVVSGASMGGSAANTTWSWDVLGSDILGLIASTVARIVSLGRHSLSWCGQRFPSLVVPVMLLDCTGAASSATKSRSWPLVLAGNWTDVGVPQIVYADLAPGNSFFLV
jgi:hypothetical protein